MNRLSKHGLLYRLSALLLAAALLLAGCSRGDPADSQPQEDTTLAAQLPVDDSLYMLDPGPDGVVPNGGGMPIAMVTNATGVDVAGRNAVVWRGIQSFALAFNYKVQLYTAVDASQHAIEEALIEAAQGGAIMVVCVGDDLAEAVYTVQEEYSTVGFLLLDAEPHNDDYSDYTARDNVHSILFQEEQAAYLAGYAAVMEGYTELGFVGTDDLPEIVRGCAGFIQGAEDAAVRQGLQVTVKTWYSNFSVAGDMLTSLLSEWYAQGTQVIFAAGSNLAESCIAATRIVGAGQVIAADWDQNMLDPTVLTTAAKGYNHVLQNELYAYFTAGGYWNEESAGRTTRVGAGADGVALPTELWRFANFSLEQYAQLYTALQSGAASVEAVADARHLPATSNVTVQAQN